MNPRYRTKLDQLLVSELELLSQAFKRLRSEGALSFAYSFTDFLDIVFAAGDWNNTHLDSR